MIQPREIQTKPLAPIVIDRVAIDDHDSGAAALAPITVPAGRHRISILYTLPEFQIPGRIHFCYRLEGWDKSWIEAGTLRDATYTGIPPGHYIFRVMNSDGYGHWTSNRSSLSVSRGTVLLSDSIVSGAGGIAGFHRYLAASPSAAQPGQLEYQRPNAGADAGACAHRAGTARYVAAKHYWGLDAYVCCLARGACRRLSLLPC